MRTRTYSNMFATLRGKLETFGGQTRVIACGGRKHIFLMDTATLWLIVAHTIAFFIDVGV